MTTERTGAGPLTEGAGSEMKAQHVEMCRSHREHWERIARETESPDERAEARHQVAYWTRLRREADDWTWVQ